MKLDNSKRMELVKGLMKDKSSNKLKRSSKRTIKPKKSSASAGSQSSESIDSLNYKCIVEVQQSWDEIKRNGLKFFELVFSRMAEIQPDAKSQMNIASVVSQRFAVVGSKVIETLSTIFLLISPEMEQMELQELTLGLRKEGVNLGVLFEVLPLVISDVDSAVKMPGTQEAWERMCDVISAILGDTL